jgi:hypothetical protein
MTTFERLDLNLESGKFVGWHCLMDNHTTWEESPYGLGLVERIY